MNASSQGHHLQNGVASAPPVRQADLDSGNSSALPMRAPATPLHEGDARVKRKGKFSDDELLEMYLEGRNMSEIAREEGISPNTLSRYVTRIFERPDKLKEVANRVALMGLQNLSEASKELHECIDNEELPLKERISARHTLEKIRSSVADSNQKASYLADTLKAATNVNEYGLTPVDFKVVISSKAKKDYEDSMAEQNEEEAEQKSSRPSRIIEHLNPDVDRTREGKGYTA